VATAVVLSEETDMGDAPFSLTEYITEIRYTPNPKILDYRGTWAEKIKVLTGLPKWRIDQNRVDVHTEEDTARAFVSYRNAGYVIQDSPTRNYFPDQANKLFRFLLQEEAFGKNIVVPRIGVRFRSATSFSGSFEELLDRYMKRYLVLTPQAKEIFGGRAIDIGGSINFSTQLGKLNTTIGPMEEQQLKQFFPTRKSVPSVALYVDLDYFKEPESEMESRDVVFLVKSYSESLWDIQDRVATLVLSEG
jgi:hypothetical protein